MFYVQAYIISDFVKENLTNLLGKNKKYVSDHIVVFTTFKHVVLFITFSFTFF